MHGYKKSGQIKVLLIKSNVLLRCWQQDCFLSCKSQAFLLVFGPQTVLAVTTSGHLKLPP